MNKIAAATQSNHSIPNEVWRVSSSSEHMGGAAATRRLLEMCALSASECVLDIGCGTGSTLVLLVREYNAHALGVDLTIEVLKQARERISESGAASRAQIILADGGCMPMNSGIFDLVVIESVLVHANSERLLGEAERVLIPGGRLGANEMTYLEPPPGELVELLEAQLGMRAHTPDGWKAVFEKAGLRMTAHEVRQFSLWEQLKGHIEADGLWGYLSALRKGLSSTRLRDVFLKREMLGAVRRFSRCVGYGLYVAEKPRVLNDDQMAIDNL